MTLPTTLPAIKLSQAERDRIERRALAFFKRLYGEQADRTLDAIGDGDGDLEARIRELYAEEAASGASAFTAFWRAVVFVAAAGALGEVDIADDNPAFGDGGALSAALTSNLDRYLAEMARLFGERYSSTSLELVFEGIETWRDRGGTVGDLRDILQVVWEGPRPVAASVTETTRILAMSNSQAWQEAGSWGFNVNIRDVNTRDEHRAVANNGPYPWSQYETYKPPVNGDVNCHCWITPVMENPNG